MKYYFRLSEAVARREAIIEGRKPMTIKLYKETEKIKNDYENNENSDLWPVHYVHGLSNEAGEFDSIEDARDEYYACEGDSIYCELHDC